MKTALGTLSCVFTWGEKWPPDHEREIIKGSLKGCTATICALPSGAFELRTSRGKTFRTVVTQCNPPGDALIVGTVNNDDLSIWINGNYIPAEGSNAAFDLGLIDRSASGPEAIEHPDAISICKVWIDWRAKNYLVTKPPPSLHQVAKTPANIFAELAASGEALSPLLRQSSTSSYPPIATIAGVLRTLLYWNGRSYKPLLFRAAALAGSLPLPVYAPRPFPRKAGFTWDQLSMSIGPAPTNKRRLSSEELLDVQEWLSRPLLFESFFGDEADFLGQDSNVLVGKELIAKLANTEGGSHSDDWSRREFERLKTVQVFGKNRLNDLVLELGSVTLGLVGWVLKNAPATE